MVGHIMTSLSRIVSFDLHIGRRLKSTDGLLRSHVDAMVGPPLVRNKNFRLMQQRRDEFSFYALAERKFAAHAHAIYL